MYKCTHTCWNIHSHRDRDKYRENINIYLAEISYDSMEFPDSLPSSAFILTLFW